MISALNGVCPYKVRYTARIHPLHPESITHPHGAFTGPWPGKVFQLIILWVPASIDITFGDKHVRLRLTQLVTTTRQMQILVQPIDF